MNNAVSLRPRNVTIAVVILCIMLLYGLVSGGIHLAHSALVAPASKNIAYTILVFGVCLNAFFVYKIFKGRNWARIVYLVFFLLGIVFAVPSFILLFTQSPTWVALSLVGYAAQVVALVLLFTGSGSEWFKRQVA